MARRPCAVRPSTWPCPRSLRPLCVRLRLASAFATWIELIFARTQAAPFSLFAFCIAIALSAALGGLGPGLLALLLSAFAIDFFIIVPGGLLDFQTSTDALVFVAFCAGWLAYCVVAERGSRRLERDRDRYFDGGARRRAGRSHRAGDRGAVARAQPGGRRRGDGAGAAARAQGRRRVDGAVRRRRTGSGDRTRRRLSAGGARDTRSRRLLGGKTPASDAIGRGAPVVDRVAARVRGGVSRAARAATPGGVQGDRGRSAAGRQPRRRRRPVRVPRAARRSRPTIASTCSCSGRAPRRRSTGRGSTSRRCAARTDADTLRARAHEELAERETIESALRASEARYRALAARTTPHARPRRRALRSGDAASRRPRRRRAGPHRRRRDRRRSDAARRRRHAFETLYGDAPDRGDRVSARFPAEIGLLRDARRSKTARPGVRRVVQRAGRSSSGGRRRSPPTADTCRRRRCRCWSKARRSACSRSISPCR